MADKRITELPAIVAADVQPDVDVLALADVSAAETKKVKVADAVAAALASGVPDGSIPGGKIKPDSITSKELAPNSVGASELADDAVDTGAIQDGAVTTGKLADGSVTSAKLASDSVTTGKIADNAVTTAKIADRSITAVKLVQNTLTANEIAPNAIGASELADNAVDTAALADDAVSTAKLQNASVTEPKLANSAVTTNKIADGAVTNAKLAGGITSDKIDGVALSKLPDAAANTVLAGPVSGVATDAAFRKLQSPDLPIGTASAVGGVSAPSAGGLAISGGGALSINNSVTAAEQPVVTYNAKGLITSGRALQGTDLPVPGSGSIGGVKQGDGITIAGDGTISQSVTGVTAGTYPKVQVDIRGNVLSGTTLSESDIPPLSFGNIYGVVIQNPELDDDCVEMRNMADGSIMYIQESLPPVTGAVFKGALWFRESTAALYAFNGNSWMVVGQGRLGQENLRYCGTFNATNSQVTGVTQFGATAGFTVGSAIPTATNELTGAYLVCDTAGNGVLVDSVRGTSFDAGDWCLCNGTAAGWVRIDTLNGGGGGGGAQRLNDLLDVNIGASPTQGEYLQLATDGQWKGVVKIDAGTY